MWSNISTSSSCMKTGRFNCDSTEKPICLLEPRRAETNSTDTLEATTNNNKDSRGSPLMRYKHAVCSASSGYIYIYGGRHGNVPLDDDVWRFDPHHNSWLQLQTRGNKPPSLQEHSLVEFNEHLYMFGGQVSASNNENSFWRLDLVNSEWHSLSLKSSKFGAYLGPTNRRGHSAVIYSDSMYIFGGFEDFRGSSAQLWEFHFATCHWELRNLSSTSACHPEPRHSHSAIVYQDFMFVYGGLTNLKPLGDLWRWSWREKRWFKERTRGKSPGPLHGHSAIQAFGSMFVFGGERQGRTTRGLWRLNLNNLTWQKIRPKGPRPSPTTWHVAIANPLSILDEANYIIEGDPDLLLRNNPLSEQSFYSETLGQTTHDESLAQDNNAQDVPKINSSMCQNNSAQCLRHSKSSTGEPIHCKGSIQQQNNERVAKRRSRLSFLRRRRPRSTYELKPMRSSASAAEIRHSIAILPTDDPSVSLAPKETNATHLSSLDNSNVRVLDNLDSDIKKMFQSALSPDNSESRRYVDDEAEVPMSLDLEQETTTTTQTVRSSQYQTAIQADGSMMDFRSQRTSYAYTTPPSELNTLRADSEQQEINSHGKETKPLVALLEKSSQVANNNNNNNSGYNQRDKRPKSEIVQSLIDRADARIKHLYTPFFNHSDISGDKKDNRAIFDNRIRLDGKQQLQQRNRLSILDKSKRHTIHQTMTYYNLYFSEDRGSSDSPSQMDTSSNSTSPKQQLVESNGDSGSSSSEQKQRVQRMVRDDMSSSTIRGSDSLTYATTNGALVGVRGCDSSQTDRQSQLSLEANSSDSKTLCGDPQAINAKNSFDQTYNNLNSSIPSALTQTRRLDTGESCDNTSLSFSVIAEFEEDDMLQYSSPTDPVIQSTQASNRTFADEYETYRRNDSTKMEVNTMRQSYNEQDRRSFADRNSQIEVKPQVVELSKLAHKSASSGYDSISGSTTNRDQKGETSMQTFVYQGPASTSDTQEDSSVRTESSLGFTTTETSPEQSAMKNQVRRMRDKDSIVNNHRKLHQKTTTSSTTADSLVLASDNFETSIVNPIAKSLPSSPVDKDNLRQQQQLVAQQQTQSKMPLMSRSRFFSNKKAKNRYWQLCMFVMGGKQSGGSHGTNEPITIWRLYI